MNVFGKALKSFNKRAVLQKAALGKPEGSWMNTAGQNVLPPVSWDWLLDPGITLTTRPEAEDINPILMLRECDEIKFDRSGLHRRRIHSARPFGYLDIISECTVDSGDVGAISYNTDRGLRGPFYSASNEIDRETYRVPNYDSFVIRPALKLTYVEAFKLLRFQIVDRLNKNGQQYLVQLIAPTIPNLHSPLVRKMVGRIIQDLLVEGADHLAPYFAEKFGAAF